ncbi:hypothetical protein KUCAC02_007001 [Chaenocephalus aceratus]|nr:hypothetical protein KUCAC02_007001 [Chaenocephalus aceratus]
MIACPAPGAEDALLGELNADGVKVTQEMIDAGTAGKKPASAGTDGAGGIGQKDLDKLEVEIKEMITNSAGAINTKSGRAVAMKIVSIMKAAQLDGSCALFSLDGLPMFGEVAFTTAKDWAGVKAFKPYEVKGSSGTYKLSLTEKDGVAITADLSTAAVTVTPFNEELHYKFDKFSIDGKYTLDGELVMKAPAATSATVMGIWEPKADNNTLKLMDGETEIATITFDPGMKLTSTLATCKLAVSDTAGAYSKEILPLTAKVTVSGAGFKDAPFEMKVTAIALKDARSVGSNLDLLRVLLGSKNYRATPSA